AIVAPPTSTAINSPEYRIFRILLILVVLFRLLPVLLAARSNAHYRAPASIRADRDVAMARVFDLELELAGVSPRIWRRVRVPAAATLPDLHHVIQAVMGWE